MKEHRKHASGCMNCEADVTDEIMQEEYEEQEADSQIARMKDQYLM